MDSHDLIREIESLARFLDLAYLPRTAAAVRSLSTIDFAKSDRQSWHSPIVEEYRREVEQSRNILGESDPAQHRALVETLDNIIIPGALRPDEFRAFLLAARFLIEAIGESHGNTRELYRSFVHGRSSTKHTYLNLCLMYLILCEGVFKNQARLLLGFWAIADRAADATAYLVKPLSPGDLLRELNQSGLDVYTAGYNRHIRNSIAHGHMRFQSDTEAMRFRDFEPSNPVAPVFDETWPFHRLAWLYAKLDDTYLIVSTYLQILFLPLAGSKGV
jgi:hypothetical protein